MKDWEEEIDRKIDSLFVEEEGRGFEEKMEAVEAQLLTLEWDLGEENIKRAKEAVEDLLSLPSCPPKVAQVGEMLKKVLEGFQDRSRITPSATKFIQRGWEAMRKLAEGGEVDTEALQELYYQLSWEPGVGRGVKRRGEMLRTFEELERSLIRHKLKDIHVY